MSMQEQKPETIEEAAPFDTLAISAGEAAGYIEKMCAELATLADRGGLGFLAYLLEVAREEAVLHSDAPPTPLVLHGELPQS
ncbi:MAG: hypothetical protein AAGB11_06220 [Pseudomonadota bacterium]